MRVGRVWGEPWSQAGCMDRRCDHHLPPSASTGFRPSIPHALLPAGPDSDSHPPRAQQPPLPETRQHPGRPPGCQAWAGSPIGEHPRRDHLGVGLFCDVLSPTGATGAVGMRAAGVTDGVSESMKS